jgi:glycine cleavage system T protein (aminomethyltransferase)
MPLPTPFFPRTSQLCTSLFWKDWAGYYAVRSYDTYMEREYYAFRHSAGMVDVTPLYKYDVTGPDAVVFLSRIMVRDAGKLKIGQVVYLCWCDDAGKVIDDGTLSRFAEDRFRVTSAEPSFAWLSRFTRGHRVTIEDVTDRLAALSIQGPTSRILLSEAANMDLSDLKYFRFVPARIAGKNVVISRTGYTGDLGFEVWVENADALAVYDAILAAGERHGLLPAGLDAMDMTRLEAGFIMNGVDYYSANHCFLESRKSTPFELALGWTVELERDPFNGQRALQLEKRSGPTRALVGLVLDWNEIETLFAKHGLPPEMRRGAWRDPVPVYDKGGRHVGQATSGTWSPLLKQNLALATVHAEHAAIGTALDMEVTVEYRRYRATARVAKKPFFDPKRKKS